MCDQYEEFLSGDEMEQQEVILSNDCNDTFIIEELESSPEMIEYAAEAGEQVDLQKHEAIIRVEEDGSRISYYCMECNLEFETKEMFMQMHQPEQHLEPAWEAISTTEENDDDDDVYYEIRSDENTEVIIEDAQERAEVELVEETYLDVLYCQTCDKIFENLDQAGAHTCPGLNSQAAVSDSDVIRFNCGVCQRFFTSIRALNIHSRTHKARRQPLAREEAAPSKIITCKICKTTFNSVKNLKLHSKMHNEKPLKSIEQALPAGAILSYNVENRFFCELCRKSFAQNLLVVHQKMHQNKPDQDYCCAICNKKYENPDSYNMHMRLHNEKSATEERRVQEAQTRRNKAQNSDDTKMPFECQFCGYRFRRPHEKVKHERVHTGEKPYKCEVCGKCFRVSYSLTLHLRSHTNVRPFVCSTCGKSFKSQNVYSHHLKTHSEARNFKCEYCQKTFRTNVQLCSHRKTHSKPYNCTLCSRPFASLYAVKLHMKTHNNKHKTFDRLKHCCAVCGATYGRQNPLQSHMREIHGIDSNFELAEVRAVGTDVQEAIDNIHEEDGVHMVDHEFILNDLPIEIVQPNEVIVGTVLDEEIVTWNV